ncbi:hypothetical protein C8R45DRAFT_1104584 [Mycena sanguinolenta]|nr:hypothetical protein C8R45DRAFT_1104584 [Mycena sanguinolenta]
MEIARGGDMMMLFRCRVREGFSFQKIDVELRLLEIVLPFLLWLFGGWRKDFTEFPCHTEQSLLAALARTVTPRLMGYFAFQTVFAISGIDTWRQVEGNFDYEEFYWTVVSLFEDGDNAHILENFNHQIFGSVAGKATTSTPTQNSEEEEDDLAAYQALRAAKKARLAAADASQAALPSSSE